MATERLTLVVGTDVQGDAVAELPGVGDLVDTSGAGGGIDEAGVQRAEARVAEAAFVVDERRRTTEGEATPLDERTSRLGGIRAQLVIDVDVHIRPQRAVGSLRTRIDAEVRAVPGRVPLHGAVLRAVGAGLHVRGTAR